MNKKLLAVAVAGAFAAPAVVFAQSSVTLFGIVDIAYMSKKHTAGDGSTHSKFVGMGDGMNAGNRVGFRGSEDLGGGLTAMFHIEQGIGPSNGQLFSSRTAAAGQQYDGISPGGNMPSGAYSTGTNRQTFVGLKGGWGEVLAGYQYTTLYRMSTLSGFFVGSEQPGGNSHGTLDNGLYGGTRANGLVYNSPRFSNFQLSVLYGGLTGRETQHFNATANTTNGKLEDDARRWSAMLNYMSGPLNVSVGYTHLNTESGPTASTGACPKNIFGACTSTTPVASSSSVSDISAKLWQIGASYQAGAFKIAGSWSKGKSNDSGTVVSEKRTKQYQGGIEYKAGAFRPFLTLGRGKTETGGVETGDFKDTQFGLRYDLSKRTTLYAMHGTTKDDAAAATAAAIQKRQVTGAGMMISF